MRTARLAALLVGLAMVAAACGGGGDGGGETGGEAQIQEGGTLSFASDQEQAGFNPNTAKDNLFALSNIVTSVYPSVFNIHPDFTVQLSKEFMDSAELTNEDPQTVVYKIKQNAVWSDGVPVTADDFIYWWENCNETNKEADCVSTTGYKDIESVKGSDNGKTVTTVYKNKFADWKSLFSQYIIPAHYTKKRPGGWNTGLDKDPEKIPSAGPYVVESYTPGQSLTLKRNDKYYGTKAHLDSIVFRYLPESTTQPAALQNNEVDMIYGQPQLDQVQIVKTIPDVTSEINFGLQYEHLDFNVKNPLLGDVAVRKAFATGLNVQEIVDRTVKQFSDKATVLGNRFFMNGQPEYQDHRGAYGNGDIAGAEKLLTDAGYAKGADGIFAKGGKRLSVNISTTAGNQLRETQEELIQAQAKEFGMEIKIKNADADVLFGKWLPEGNFDIANFAWVGTPFAVSSNQPIFSTDSAQNYGKYSNPKVDELFTQAISELDAAKSAELGNQVDQLLWEDMATLPLYQKPQLIGWRNKFTGIGDNLSSQGPFWNASTWAQKAA
ncbi:MAG TPA: ABC transporter family substrate-binding protein [Actinomycetota bacterium]|nr:ABC transporter family substrate-binding protein [Actinomycetota bacterium]